MQSDGEVPVMLELSGMRSTPLLPLLPDPLRPGAVALLYGKKEQNYVLMPNLIVEIELFLHLTVSKQKCTHAKQN